MLTVALAVLHHELRHVHYRDILAYLHGLPRRSVLLSILCVGLSYLSLTLYDWIALIYLRRPVHYTKVALTAFISYAFSNSTGMGTVAGGALRFRLYSTMGLSTLATAKVILFNLVTFVLGLCGVGALVFVLDPVAVPRSLHLPFLTVRPIGVAMLVAVGGYFLAIFFRRAPIRLREWEFTLPSIRLSAVQLVISMADWTVAAAVLYLLLPPHAGFTFPQFMTFFILGQVCGLVSQLPGGVGVFEMVILYSLRGVLPTSAVMGALLAFRIFYYILPLLVAAILLATFELIQRRRGLGRLKRLFGHWAPHLVPYALALTTLLGGLMLLFSGATPSVGERLHWVNSFIPLPVMELSHLLGSLVGLGLILLAHGLIRRLDAAYVMTVILLAWGAVFSLLKGWDYEEAVVLSLMLLAFLPSRRRFYRRASLLNDSFSLTWLLALALVLLATGWIGLFSYKHVGYRNDLWWHVSLLADTPRFMRAMFVMTGVSFGFGLWQLMRPARGRPHPPQPEEWEQIESIVARAPHTYAQLAYLGDKSLLWNERGNAFIMYGVEGRSWIAMGDPVGPAEELPELVWRFRELSDQYAAWAVYYQIHPENLETYLDLGLVLLKLGEEAIIPLADFSLEGGARKTLRGSTRRLEKEGYSFELMTPEQAAPHMALFRSISDGWISMKNTREKAFSLGRFDEDYLSHFPIGVVRRGEQIVAFTNVMLGAGNHEMSVDLMRHLPDAPSSLMDYLFVQVMLWGKAQGYRYFNMGMAPLSGLENRSLAPMWNRLGYMLFRHGEHFYNFQGLRQFKEKFHPNWSPRYLATPGGLAMPRILTNVATLIAGGVKAMFMK